MMTIDKTFFMNWVNSMLQYGPELTKEQRQTAVRRMKAILKENAENEQRILGKEPKRKDNLLPETAIR